MSPFESLHIFSLPPGMVSGTTAFIISQPSGIRLHSICITGARMHGRGTQAYARTKHTHAHANARTFARTHVRTHAHAHTCNAHASRQAGARAGTHMKEHKRVRTVTHAPVQRAASSLDGRQLGPSSERVGCAAAGDAIGIED
jgi:hypothetical protein